MLERLHYPASSPAVAVGVGREGHLVERLLVGQQQIGRRRDRRRVRADQPQGAGLEPLGALRRLTGDEHRRAEGGSLLLHAARVRDGEPGGGLDMGERHVFERSADDHLGEVGHRCLHLTPGGRVRVGDQDDLHFGVPLDQQAQPLADPGQPASPALPAVGGGQHERTRTLDGAGDPRVLEVGRLPSGQHEGVDARVAGDEDLLCVDPLADQVHLVEVRGCQVERRDA